MVVDDNPDAANTLATILRTSGHEVHIATDGHSAIELAIRVRPEVMLLDIGLPGLDGFSVAKRLRAESSLAHMRIIAVTGIADEGDRQRAMEAGIDQHLIKPVDPAFLQSLLGPAGR
ncbi:MAG: hypothetical protein A3G81_07650 [Betaproteobacteria bacterium RIFCSPLOWO2_12_FULL_65_14]|nr:MAG: hypothetical protein A3G81_07650 [Betaproteobacteria bacterium RIFCSPLOWO2_12_FULL_65_14]